MPQVVRSPEELRTALAGRGRVGLVPTMGYLHDGHATLMRRAREVCDVLVVSIFVNPLQFGPSEDLAAYPRDLERDLGVVGEAGVDVVFMPDAATMYPPNFDTRVTVSGLSEGLDGESRPGHFTGVATVVLKLLNLVRPDVAFFGEKDWQQLAVLRQMVRDLNVSVQVVGLPTVRAPSGLALSSRNSYLSADQQARATVLSRALRAVQAAYAGGETDSAKLRQAGLDVLNADPEVALDYLSLVGRDMRESKSVDNGPMTRVLVAARMFGVRLIDNMPLVVAAQQADS
ncbi:pantoate--beta-alanine ligase [Deinococcus arenicola]|uniref:Pantothenate synthetase n=1 Tax=Deinococcus arenicola TaxID=2994950 RepID=A0ABU4DP65_9DEIO|nr:pantoate--beta-alanine ligase [Deinococcus sp. ZS9-10]MDV6373889.1 pantoate--beta-alanine ligase [Deinococcus sp. ZS9-10]